MGVRSVPVHISITDVDLGAGLRHVNERLDHQARTLTRIERNQEIIMGLVAIEQGDLDSIAVTITQAADTLQAVLDSEAPLDPADEAGVQDALTKLKSVGPRVPTNPAPVPDPGTSADPAVPADPSTPADPAAAPSDPAPADPAVDPAADPSSTDPFPPSSTSGL